MGARFRFVGCRGLVLVGLVAGLTACGGGGGGGDGASPGVSPEVQRTADALAQPDTAEQGVWRMLELLGIGVYTPEGEQRLAGSERGEDDFWLYDFEVPILASMAGQTPEPFDVLYGVVKENGFGGAAEDLRAAYQAAYDAHPDHPLVELLRATGADFTTQPRLTPLQQWLLLLDTFVPPNGSGAARAGRRQADSSTCGGLIQGGNLVAMWGVAGPNLNLVLSAYDAYVAMHGALLARAATVAFEGSPREIHAGHNGATGESARFTVWVEATYSSLPSVAAGCGVLTDATGGRFLSGPLEGAVVLWEYAPLVSERIWVPRMDGATDPSGQASLELSLVPEDGDGVGALHEEAVTVTPQVDVKAAYQAAGITSPRLLAMVPDRIPAGAATVVVSWHEPCDTFTLHYVWRMEQDPAPGFSQNAKVEGSIPLTIDYGDTVSAAPGYPVSGQADLQITGGGTNSLCSSWTLSGTDQVTMEGKILPGDPPRLELTVQHAQTAQVTPSECAFWMPLSFPETVELDLRDGAGAEVNMEAGSGTISAGYTVELSCQPDGL